MATPTKYWSAVPISIYEKNLQLAEDIPYYTFHGKELVYSESIGDVIQTLTRLVLPKDEQGWMVFKYIPVSSSMQKSLWDQLQAKKEPDEDDLVETKIKEPKVKNFSYLGRVYEKFTFPHAIRSRKILETENNVTELIGEPIEDVDATILDVQNLNKSEIG